MCIPDAAFQCSSASRKFLNFWSKIVSWFDELCFSALQRAENSSIGHRRCRAACGAGFSALQRAENSSILERLCCYRVTTRFSALQRAENSSIVLLLRQHSIAAVSVLFSEPKIPQCAVGADGDDRVRFQCSSASRKFLNLTLD